MTKQFRMPKAKSCRERVARCVLHSGLVLLSSFVIRHSLFSQSPATPAELEAKSLPLRTALHHDPTLAPPLERLVQLYTEAGRAKELVGVYRQHVAQYPADTGALIVLVRLLVATGDPEAGRVARAAAEGHPENAFLQFLLFEHLQRTREPGALDALDRAISKETLPTRKRAWVEQLLPLAAAENRADVAKRHLEILAAESRTADEKLDVARKMIAQKLHEPALATLTAATALTPAAETGVEIELAAASAEQGLGRGKDAAARLDRLLSRLAADYWRRAEILHRRTALVQTDSEREAMLGAARARWKAAPGSDTTALELAQLLAAFEFRREALDVLIDAARRVPASEKIERAALDLFDRLRDERGREALLAERLRAAPERQDLALAHTRSLFLLGRRNEALAAWDALAPKLDDATRLTQLLELARFLRRSALHADAAELFTRAVALAPSRLDVRRELAETWLAIGQKAKAREAFAGALPEETETETLLDAVQFFLKQEMFAEAQRALAARVAKEPQNFDLRLMQLTVATRLADATAGEKLIAETRSLADTDARYRRWLEGAIAFHQAFETDAAFVANEQERLEREPGGWEPGQIERRLIFAEVSAAHGHKAEVAAMLAGALGGDLPQAARIELRRRQFALLENDPAQAAAAEEQLKALMKDDPARADEYRIRLALLHARAQRTDLAAGVLREDGSGEILAGIDVSKVNDASLLTALDTVMRQWGNVGPSQFRILERITALEPANRGAWERWLTALATAGDEERLRAALGRLIAGIDRMPLSEETRALLQDHLLASHWRSLAKLLHNARDEEKSGGEPVRDAEPGSFTDALPLLESASRLAATREENMWIAWARGYVLNGLGRTAARDEAIRELERIAAQPAAAAIPAAGQAAPLAPRGALQVANNVSTGSGARRQAAGPLVLQSPGSPSGAPASADETEPAETDPALHDAIAFPDGTTIALGAARELLTTNPAARNPASPIARSGPSGTARVRWAFDTDRQAPVTKVLPLDPTRVLVLDAAGRIYIVDAANGKLLWSREGPPPLTMQNENGYSGSMPSSLPPAVPVHAEGRLFLATAQGVECWSADDGRLLWRATGFAPASGAMPVPMRLFADGARLLVCDPLAPSVAALDAKTGKALWQRTYPAAAATVPLTAFNCGASFSDGRILLYGSATRIVRAEDGETQWLFDAARVRDFPVALGESAAPVAPVLSGMHAPRFTRWRGGNIRFSSSMGSGMNPGGFAVLDYLQQRREPHMMGWTPQPGQRLAFASPAAAWAAMGDGQPRLALLRGERLLLFGQQEARALRLDLPFAGTGAGMNGVFIGIAGRMACVLAGGGVGTMDLDSGKTVQIPLVAQQDGAGEMQGMNAPGRAAQETFEAAVDGPVLYVSSRSGLAAYHTRTGQRVWQAAWPKSVAPKAAEPLPGGSGHYFLPHGAMRIVNGRYGALEPLASAVQDGVFYTTSEPSRVVAIVGEEAKP